MTRAAAVFTLLAALALPATALLPGCGDSPSAAQARRRSAEAWDALRAYGEDQREALARDLDARLAELDRELETLARRARGATAGLRESTERQLAELREHRGALAERLEALRRASKEAWGSARDAAVDAFESLSDGIDAAERSAAQ